MPVNIDSDLVSSRFDKVRQLCIYTAKSGERRWTVEIPARELFALGGNKTLKRQTVTRYLQSAMSGPSDDERQK